MTAKVILGVIFCYPSFNLADTLDMSMFSEIKEIFPLDINCDDPAEVANLEVPVAKFYKDDFKLHRRGLAHITLLHTMHTQITNRYACTVKLHIPSDVGLALIKYNPTFKKMNQKDKSQFLDEFEGKKGVFLNLTVTSLFFNLLPRLFFANSLLVSND